MLKWEFIDFVFKIALMDRRKSGGTRTRGFHMNDIFPQRSLCCWSKGLPSFPAPSISHDASHIDRVESTDLCQPRKPFRLK